MNTVQAVIRIKPLTNEEKMKGKKQGWSKIGERGIIQHLGAEGQEVSAQAMFFDWVFSPSDTNERIFSHLLPVMKKSLEGINTCVIAYGQTSSGKTHTMRGSIQDALETAPKKQKLFPDIGIIPKYLQYIFEHREGHTFTVSFIEIYNENIYDLLGDPGETLQIREQVAGETYIQNSTEIQVRTEEEAFEVYLRGERARKVGATKMNRESSRSHAVLKIRIKNEMYANTATFVDLAGSERSKMTKTEGESLKEGGHINKSLLALTSVVSKLSKKHAHIPYRDAKLTRILQPSLSGNSLTVIVCNVSALPECAEETASTLNLANRAKNIEVKPVAKGQKRPERHQSTEMLRTTEEALGEIKRAQSGIREIKTAMEEIQNEIREIVVNTAPRESTELGKLLKELRETKTKHLSKLSELSISVQYLLKQEKRLSESIHPPPDTKTLLAHLVEGDRLIQQQREQIKALLSAKGGEGRAEEAQRQREIDRQSISLALEIDRLKKEHQKEKRMLQLKIAQLEGPK